MESTPDFAVPGPEAVCECDIHQRQYRQFLEKGKPQHLPILANQYPPGYCADWEANVATGSSAVMASENNVSAPTPPAPDAQPTSITEPREEELDASIEAEINNEVPETTGEPMNVEDDKQPEGGDTPAPGAAEPEIPEPRIPQKKDQALRELLNKMDDYSPIIPDAVIDYHMALGGLPPPPETPRQLSRLVALATQKFISDIAADAYQYARIRSSNTSSNNPMNLGAGVPGAAGAPAGGAGGAAGAAGAGGAAGAAASGDKGKAANLGQPRPGFGGGGQGGAQGRTVLTLEDLGQAVAEYGINLKRPEWFR